MAKKKNIKKEEEDIEEDEDFPNYDDLWKPKKDAYEHDSDDEDYESEDYD